MTGKVIKFTLKDILFAVIIFVIVMFAIELINIGVLGIVSDTSGISFQEALSQQDSNGFDMSTAVFLFIVGLVSFKANFRFTQANNITRRDFWLGSLCTLFIAATLTSCLMFFYGMATNSMPLGAYMRGNFSTLPPAELIKYLPLQIVSSASLAFLGFFISSMYYRLSTLGKWLVSLIPVYFMILMNLILPRLGDGVQAFIESIMQIGNFLQNIGFLNPNPLISTLPMLVICLIAGGLSFLFVRRAPAFR